MLVDVKFRLPDAEMATMLSLVGSGGSPMPERIGEGMYLMNHWNADSLVAVRERWCEKAATWLDFDECGVCDTPEQAVEKLNLRERPERFFITFVRLRRSEQPPDGGWRWHKWGEYIGDREPRCEYLHDEPEIEEVYTFRVYKPVLAAGN